LQGADDFPPLEEPFELPEIPPAPVYRNAQWDGGSYNAADAQLVGGSYMGTIGENVAQAGDFNMTADTGNWFSGIYDNVSYGFGSVYDSVENAFSGFDFSFDFGWW
jgi:hypothetical protein